MAGAPYFVFPLYLSTLSFTPISRPRDPRWGCGAIMRTAGRRHSSLAIPLLPFIFEALAKPEEKPGIRLQEARDQAGNDS